MQTLLTVPSLRPLGVDSDRCRSLFSLVIDFWRSSTVGQMAVGGRTCTLCSPKLHSGFTWDAHRLCSCRKKGKEIFSALKISDIKKAEKIFYKMLRIRIVISQSNTRLKIQNLKQLFLTNGLCISLCREGSHFLILTMSVSISFNFLHFLQVRQWNQLLQKNLTCLFQMKTLTLRWHQQQWSPVMPL